jgi:two-component system response regulator YesN
MIVDDEYIIREELVKCINWERNGYKVVGEAKNGKEALKKAIEIKPHIIITDIYMPIMKGIELSKEVKKILPDIIIVFLSGYNEFEDARKALDIGIASYLTKPVDESKLFDILSKETQNLNTKKKEHEQYYKLKKIVNKNLSLLKERFFLNLIRGLYKENEISDTVNYFNINSITANSYLSMIVRIDDYFNIIDVKKTEEINIIKFGIQNLFLEELKNIKTKIYIFEDKRNELAILFCINKNNETDNFTDFSYPVIKKIQQKVFESFNTTISIGIGKEYVKLSDVHKSYSEAEYILDYKTTFGKNCILSIDKIKTFENISPLFYNSIEINSLINAVKDIDLETSNKILEKIFTKIKNELLKKESIHIVLIDLISKFLKCILEKGGNIKEVYGEDFEQYKIFKCDTIDKIEIFIKEIMIKTIDFLSSKYNSKNKNIVSKTKEYIDNNYKQNIKLETVARYLQINECYLSMLFKKISDESFIDYLTKIRLNHAKRYNGYRNLDRKIEIL